MRLSCLLSFSVLASFIALLVGCGGDDGYMGATASLSWDPGHDQPGVTYTVHYGKDSSGEFGSCNYEHAVDVTDPAITIAGLDVSTRYYFAVSDTGTGTVHRESAGQALGFCVSHTANGRVLQDFSNDAVDVMP